MCVLLSSDTQRQPSTLPGWKLMDKFPCRTFTDLVIMMMLPVTILRCCVDIHFCFQFIVHSGSLLSASELSHDAKNIAMLTGNLLILFATLSSISIRRVRQSDHIMHDIPLDEQISGKLHLLRNLLMWRAQKFFKLHRSGFLNLLNCSLSALSSQYLQDIVGMDLMFILTFQERYDNDYRAESLKFLARWAVCCCLLPRAPWCLLKDLKPEHSTQQRRNRINKLSCFRSIDHDSSVNWVTTITDI